jgi:NDP-sugar pyrophosphorylase family protein
MSRPALLVLAAGIGSRYGGLKQIDPVGPGGETIIDYSVYDALRAGFEKVVFVIRHDLEQPFKEAFGNRFERQLPVEYVFQELEKLPAGYTAPPSRKKPWGTGHAILMAAEVIRGPFAAINADDFYGQNSLELLARHLQSGSSDYAMVGFILKNTLSEYGAVARGLCRATPEGLLEQVTELTRIEKEKQAARYTDAAGQIHPLTGDEIVSMNIWGFTPAIFDQLRRGFSAFLKENLREEKAEFYIPVAVNALVAAAKARVRVLRTPDSWFGVTYREDRPRVVESIRALVQSGRYPERLWG